MYMARLGCARACAGPLPGSEAALRAVALDYVRMGCARSKRRVMRRLAPKERGYTADLVPREVIREAYHEIKREAQAAYDARERSDGDDQETSSAGDSDPNLVADEPDQDDNDGGDGDERD